LLQNHADFYSTGSVESQTGVRLIATNQSFILLDFEIFIIYFIF